MKVHVLIFAVLTLALASTLLTSCVSSGSATGTTGRGQAVIDGVVNDDEWAHARQKAFTTKSRAGDRPFRATLRVMNDAEFLYIGITIDDDEFTIEGTWLPRGDGFRIDFDNRGSLFEFGDNVVSIAAGEPQFFDGFIKGEPSEKTSHADTEGGGTLDGEGAASRIGDLNHFEVKIPLCSGDDLDFCLQPGDSVGFQLEYLDAESNGDFGGSQHYPGYEDNSVARFPISTYPE